MRKVPTAILISGRGSNMMALAQAALQPDYPAKIVVVASNNPEALGLQRAADLGIPVIALDHRSFKTRKDFDRALHKELKKYEAQIICCAGFMRILSPEFVEKWTDRVINIHPSLLPKYKGLHTHKRAIEAGDKFHGCSVHYVTEVLDSGSVIAQKKVPVSGTDTPESLADKILEIEHPLYIEALKKVASERRFQP